MQNMECVHVKVFGPAGFNSVRVYTNSAGPNVRHGFWSFRSLCSRMNQILSTHTKYTYREEWMLKFVVF